MRKGSLLVATVMTVWALVMAPVAAMELPPGVTFKVLAQFPSKIPGIARVELQELTLAPGAKWENITVGDTGY